MEERDYDQEILDLIDSGTGKKENIIKELLECEIYTDEGSEHRWETWYGSIAKVKDRYFQFYYALGNTEMQENNYDGEFNEIFFDKIEPIQKVKVYFKGPEGKSFSAFEAVSKEEAYKTLQMEVSCG